MIVITGASDGLGKELAALYSAGGKRVINMSRDASSVTAENITLDLSSEQSIIAACDQLLGDKEPIEAVIQCAGTYSGQTFGDVDVADLERNYWVNALGPMLLTKRLLDRVKHDGADLVYVVSTTGTKPTPEATYGSSKWALRGYVLGLQAALKQTKCRVVCFSPGGMKTKFFEKWHDDKRVTDGSTWMDPASVAVCLKQLLDLPKSIEVSEVILNRKS